MMLKHASKQLQRYYPRLSGFYFFFFAALGAFVPYWTLYLQSLGFNPIQIGELMAIVMGSKLLAPYLLGWLSDHLQKKMIIIQGTMLFAIIAFASVLPYQSYWWFVCVMAVFGFFWNAALPLFESITLTYLGKSLHYYSHIRLWGSVGFILMVVLVPFIIQGNKINLLPLVILGLLIANGLTTLFIPETSEVSSSPTNSVLMVLKSPIVITFLLVCALQTLSHGAYYTFFSIYLEDHHYSRRLIGVMWALGVIAEVILFLFVHYLFNRYQTCTLLTIALFLTAIRWVMLALWVDYLWLLVIAQLFHAASFGLFHATAIHLTHKLFPGRLQGRGQALYAGLSFGLGGALGNWLSGHSWETMGSTWTFYASAIIALIGAMIAMLLIKEQHLPDYAKN